jgi:hypothetical protein
VIEICSLLIRCREHEAELTATPEGKLRIQAPAPLPDALRDELKQRKTEVLALLDVMTWLRSHLVTPQRLAPLIVAWVEYEAGRSVDILMDARWVLGVGAYVGEDGRVWWQLQQPGLQ